MSAKPAAEPLEVLALSGSLRRQSFNAALLRSAAGLAPPGLVIRIADLSPLPLYDADVDDDEKRPLAVRELKQGIEAADAVVFATPEYNHGVSGVLKNAIDWASRPSHSSPLLAKPVTTMGASPGLTGTVRAQQQLKLVLLATRSHLFPHPGVAVGGAREKFDQTGALTDENTRQFLTNFLADFEGWLRRLPASSE